MPRWDAQVFKEICEEVQTRICTAPVKERQYHMAVDPSNEATVGCRPQKVVCLPSTHYKDCSGKSPGGQVPLRLMVQILKLPHRSIWNTYMRHLCDDDGRGVGHGNIEGGHSDDREAHEMEVQCFQGGPGCYEGGLQRQRYLSGPILSTSINATLIETYWSDLTCRPRARGPEEELYCRSRLKPGADNTGGDHSAPQAGQGSYHGGQSDHFGPNWRLTLLQQSENFAWFGLSHCISSPVSHCEASSPTQSSLLLSRPPCQAWNVHRQVVLPSQCYVASRHGSLHNNLLSRRSHTASFCNSHSLETS